MHTRGMDAPRIARRRCHTAEHQRLAPGDACRALVRFFLVIDSVGHLRLLVMARVEAVVKRWRDAMRGAARRRDEGPSNSAAVF